ncbi:MAG: hypothetical protein AAFV96_01955, partial [Pseudomonadota bacterium]
MSAPQPLSTQPQPEPLGHIAALAPYPRAVPARADAATPVLLAQNESLRPPSPRAIAAAVAALGDALYSDPDWTELLHGACTAQDLVRGKPMHRCDGMEQ